MLDAGCWMLVNATNLRLQSLVEKKKNQLTFKVKSKAKSWQVGLIGDWKSPLYFLPDFKLGSANN